jgi:hypothetical protein
MVGEERRCCGGELRFDLGGAFGAIGWRLLVVVLP